MKEDFIQNVQFDLFTIELVIGETATLLMAENYVTIREVFVDEVKVEPNEEKQIFLQSGGNDLWELNEGDVLQPKDNKTFTIKKASEVDTITGSTDKYLNEQGKFTKPITNHKDLENKNAEPEFQHVTQEEKDLISSTATIVSGHTEDISELQTNKADKSTTLSGYGITNAYTKTEIDNNKQDKNKVITDVVVNNFISSSVYTEYPYEASIAIPGVLSTHLGEVIYNLVDVLSTNFAPICETYNGGVKIFSKTNSTITIKTIIIFI